MLVVTGDVLRCVYITSKGFEGQCERLLNPFLFISYYTDVMMIDMSDEKSKNIDNLQAMRHSLAHIMASSVQRLWPNAKFGVGPVVENGFYYDIDLGDIKLSDSDFPRIESEMHRIIEADELFEKINLSIEEAIEWAKQNDQPYKLELLYDLQRSGTTAAKDINPEELGIKTKTDSKVSEVSFYRNGDFSDLCKGPHVKSTASVGKFKLLRISGAYWRGDEHKPQMQRIYGLAFPTEADIDKHLDQLEDARQRDHRKLGQELDLFTFSELVGSGLPLFTPRGTILRTELNNLSQELQTAAGYEAVSIPHIAKIDLYQTSGHYDKFAERFTVTSEESDDVFLMKPMNCPHHTQIYASRARSYRDLPIRYMETTMVYRDEKAGELHGLSRVRAATQDDSHAFCREDQIEAEFEAIANMVKIMYNDVFDMPFRVRLAFRNDSDKYLGSPELWESAQKSITSITDKLKLDYVIEEGEATFYGPKIEFIVQDSLGREWQCATIQLDFVQPERFGLEYTANDGTQQRPVMIHKALLGSIERFMSVYIEHTDGKFPVWCAPEQIRLITVNQEEVTESFATEIVKQFKAYGLRVTVDNSSESVGKKIRASEIMKVPYTLVIGQKEIESNKVIARIRADLSSGKDNNELAVSEFLKTVANEASSRASKSTL
jgi:threonyl-tRNA synthetase